MQFENNVIIMIHSYGTREVFLRKKVEHIVWFKNINTSIYLDQRFSNFILPFLG